MKNYRNVTHTPEKRKDSAQVHCLILCKNLFAQTETLVETIHTAAGIVQLLLTGEERMALGTNFHTDILLGRAGRDHVAAGTGDGGLLVYGMDALFHACHLFRETLD